MLKSEQFLNKADQFAARAAAAKARTLRNTFLSLEQTCRNLAASEQRREAARTADATLAEVG
jgi:hypothetical protein